MSGFNGIIKPIQQFVVKNSPAILTVVGAAGTITTAILTARASFEAANVIRIEKDHRVRNALADAEDHEFMTKREQIEAVWTLYIPPATTAALTIAAIVFANRIESRRAAALAVAFSLTEKALGDYKNKVVEIIGEKKEQTVRDAIAKDRVAALPLNPQSIVFTENGESLALDLYTQRYFMSSVETLKKAMNDLNYRLNQDGYASLSDFYDLIGLKQTSNSEDVGWTNDKLLELDLSTQLADNQKPCITFDFMPMPKPKFYSFH